MFREAGFGRSLQVAVVTAGADVMNDRSSGSDKHNKGSDRDDKEDMHHEQDIKCRDVRASKTHGEEDARLCE